jgi:hypothetical protein
MTTTHTWYECPPQADGKPAHYDREYGSCMFCDGGLGSCTVCDGFEGSLPSECPGHKATREDLDELVYKGTLDFKDGRWYRREYQRWETPDPEKEAIVDAAVVRLNKERECNDSNTSSTASS